jgi:hypothetical protein
LLRLFRDAVASEIIYAKLKNLRVQTATSLVDRLVTKYKYYRAQPIDRLFERARLDGIQLGEKKIQELGL